MTTAQFAAIAKLLRVRDGAAREAACLVLVDGHRPSEAARLTGLSASSVSNAVSRFKRGLELAQVAAAA
ncbi:MAG: hypothetical protein A3E79_00115 [Burkholderiales bacterium RIFCSPHIGHO2_12_FULL_61_11]|nr:MAG: hypothetical protein A3E79_00115 [Burkholderiales bacterium RIFCSPHIGHO2_12_FULL_61_11]